MFKLGLMAGLLFFLFQGACGLGHAEDPAQILAGLKARYGRESGIRLPYTREVITSTMALLGGQVKGDLATGMLHFKTPHFLRLEQETPKMETIVSDGDTLWWCVPDQRQVYRYPAKTFGRELSLLGDLFLGLKKVEDTFTLTLLGQNDQGHPRIELKPDPPWENIERIVMTVTREKGIRRVDIHNQIGGITRFILGDVEPVATFEAGFFRFSVPEGFQLIQEES